MSGFIFTVSSNHRGWYLFGTILFLLLSIGLAIGGFASGNTGLGITGIVMGVASLIFVIDAFMNL